MLIIRHVTPELFCVVLQSFQQKRSDFFFQKIILLITLKILNLKLFSKLFNDTHSYFSEYYLNLLLIFAKILSLKFQMLYSHWRLRL